MADSRREAALSLRLEDIEAFLSDLDRVLTKLNQVRGMGTGPTSGGSGGTMPPLPLTGAVGGYTGGFAPGDTSTFSAIQSQAIPLTPPPSGTPQQWRVGLFGSQGHGEPAPMIGFGTGSAITPPVPPGPGQPPGSSPEWRGSSALAPTSNAIVPYAPPSFAADPGGNAGVPWWQRSFNMPPWFSRFGLEQMGQMYAGHWAVSRAMDWFGPGVAASAQYARGYYVAPEDISVRNLAYQRMGLGIGLGTIGLAVGGPIGAGVGYGLGSAIGGFREQIGGAELQRDKDLRLISELTGLRGGADSGYVEQLVSGMLLTPKGGGSRTFAQGWIDKLANLLQYGSPGGVEQTALLEVAKHIEGIQDVIPGLTGAMQTNAGLESQMLRIAAWTTKQFGGNRMPIMRGQQRLLSDPSMFWHAASPILEGMAPPMLMGPKYAGVTAMRLAATGNLKGLADIEPFAQLPPDAWNVAWNVAGHEWQAGFGQELAAEWEPTADYRRARGGSPESIYGARMGRMRGLNRSWDALLQERKQFRYAWDAARKDPNYSWQEDMGWQRDYTRLNTRVGRAAATSLGAEKSAGLEWIDEYVNIYGAGAQMAEMEGRSPAPYYSAQASVLGRAGSVIGNARLTPGERAGYALRTRSAELGAIEAERGWTGGIAMSRQRGARAGISERLAGGEIWSSELEQAYTDVGRFVQDRIGAIDTAIQQYAANGIKDKAKVEGLRAERAELQAAYKQVQVEAFETKYSRLGVPIRAAEGSAEAGVGRVTGLGRSAEELKAPFALQSRAAEVGVGLAQSKYDEAVRRFGPTSAYALMAGVELEEARSQQALLPVRQIDTEYGLRARPWAAYAGAYGEQASVQEAAGGSRKALPSRLQSISMADMLAGVSGDRYEALRKTPGVGAALLAEAWEEKTGKESDVKRKYLSLGNYTPPPELEERLRQAEFGQSVLQSTMTARGSVRAMARERMGAAEEEMADLMRYRSRVLSQIPAELRPSVELQLNDQMRGLQMKRVAAQQELEQGWLERLVANVWNQPGNFSLVANEFNYAGAVMRGVKGRHLGSTSEDLDYYRDQAFGYATLGGSGRFGSPRQFAENALSGVTDVALGLPFTLGPRRMSGGASGSLSAPPVGAGASPGSTIRVEVVVMDKNGGVLGSAVENVLQDAWGNNAIHLNLGNLGTANR